MQGRIDKAEYNDNNNLRLQIAGQWYTAKPPELAQMVGQTITFEPSPWQIPNTNKTINYINDYVLAGAHPTPADQAMNQAMNQAPPMGSQYPPEPTGPGAAQPRAPQTPSVDRDASIQAQALTKAMVGLDTPDKAFSAYKALYHMCLTWNPAADIPELPSQTPYDDSIPY